MCQFFSLISDNKGKAYYFDWKLRKQCLDKKLNYKPDSHTSIADYFGFKGEDEDRVNKYEYNPLNKIFKVDKLNTVDDSKKIEKQCNKLDFKKIIPQLIIKPIIHPFRDIPERKKVTSQDIELLKQWASVRVSVYGSVWASVSASVSDSVRASVYDSVWASVSVSVPDSVWASVRASVSGSVSASVSDSVWAYIGSFFILKEWKYIKHKKGKYPYQSVVDLWERGLVPSYDGKTWRLHTGKNAKIIYEIQLRMQK